VISNVIARILATWVALLRAVNLGSRNKVPMAELRRLLEDEGYGDVRTVIASGNVVFDRAKPSARSLEKLIADAFGVDTTVLLRSAAQIRKLAAAKPFASNAYVAFLAKRPTAAVLRSLDGLDEHELVGSDLVLHFPKGYSAAQLTGAVLEKHLGTQATVRNWRTVEKLAALVG
jgi:uncharacterized protein (DUF1697 family)